MNNVTHLINAGAGGQAHEKADQHIDNGAHVAYGRVGVVGGVVAHHPGVNGIVKLLEDIAQQQRKSEGNNMEGDIALGHIHILPGFPGKGGGCFG